jgi:hypothetical protein
MARSNRSTANLLQQPLRPETSDGIDDRHYLPLKQPAGHRKTNRRVAQMHHSHNHPRQARSSRCRSQGEAPQKLYRHNSNRHHRRQGTSVPSKWHGSNTSFALPNKSLRCYVGCGKVNYLRHTYRWMLDESRKEKRCHSEPARSGGEEPAFSDATANPYSSPHSERQNHPSVRRHVFFHPPRRRHHHSRQAAFRRQLLERRQIAPLQIFPTSNQLPALPFQFRELPLLSLGRR